MHDRRPCQPSSVPWKVIHYFARKSDFSICNDAVDMIMVNKNYLSITAARADKRMIHLTVKSVFMEKLDSDNEFKTGKKK